MRILVTGADGFVGRALVQRLAVRQPNARIVATDRAFREPASAADVHRVELDLADRVALSQLCRGRFDLVYHLASIPGAAAERLADAGRAINRDAALQLVDLVATEGAGGPAPRFIYASSIAVYGPLPPGRISEDWVTYPVLSYGAHKLMVEIELADRIRRGELTGASLRLPGIVARPAEESGHGSAFMSRIFSAAADGAAYVCPVSRQATCWWMSRKQLVDNLIHAASVEDDLLSGRSSWQLPVLVAQVGEVIDGLGRRHGHVATAAISHQPDPGIERLFGAMPALATPVAERAGFAPDASVDELVNAVTA